MTAPTLAVRADGGPGIGSGHLGRCLALVQAWLDAGGAATLVSSDPPGAWADRYRAEGATVREPGADAWYADQDWVVLDSYRLGRELQCDVREAGARLLVVDDGGRSGGLDGAHLADVVLDQNLGADTATYQDRLPGSRLLLGPGFALLRREFRPWAAWERPIAPEARRVLVSPGGSPAGRTRDFLADVLADQRLAGLTGRWLTGDSAVPAEMAGADVALALSGSTCWELGFMGLPVVLLAAAANQEPLADAMEAAGAAVNAGFLGRGPTERVASSLADLAGDPSARAEMSRRGRRLVDGRGARRVVAWLRAGLLALRPVSAGDSRLLWEWANEPATRAMAFESEPIGWDTHTRWVDQRLRDPRSRMFVAATPDGRDAGLVRFQGDDREMEIGLSLAPSHRGAHWGSALILAGVDRVLATGDTGRLVARVKPENAASRAAFETAGFRAVDRGDDGRNRWLRFVLERAADPTAFGASALAPSSRRAS